MPTSRERGRHRTERRPIVERIEPRLLLSVTPFLRPTHNAAPSIHLAAVTNGSTLNTSNSPPTPHELRRQAFDARFQGHYTVGRGRFTDQARQVFFIGGGTSNQFLHGNLEMAYQIPTDPVAAPTGTAELFGKDIANTGTQLSLDLQFDPRSMVNGLPTRFTWTANGSSAGSYSNASGQGTGQIIYFPSGKLPQRALGAGRYGVVFQGLVAKTGIGDIRRLP